MSRNALVNSEAQKYGQEHIGRPHVFHSDEPGEHGCASCRAVSLDRTEGITKLVIDPAGHPLLIRTE
jgi:hypothetical protein